MLKSLLRPEDDEYQGMDNFGDELKSAAGATSLAEEVNKETEAPRNAPAVRYNANQTGITLKAVEENIKLLREKYPKGGREAARVITSRILMQAPRDFFVKFQNDVKLGVAHVAGALAESDASDLIAEAYADPYDKVKLEKAYQASQRHVVDFLSKRGWVGPERAIVSALIIDEIVGWGIIDPLWQDGGIDEIIISGPNLVRIEVRGRLFSVASARWRDQDHLMLLTEKLLRRSDKLLSQSHPRIKGRMYDNSRIYGVHPIIAPSGPNVNIRRHPEKHWTPLDMVNNGAASAEMMTEIGNMVWKGCTFLVVGGMSTGKTSMLNALTGFYRNDALIVTVEDSIEMKPNPNKMLHGAQETRIAGSDSNADSVTMRDLVQSATQQRPDVIIVGEVTDGAAYDLAQALNLGKAGGSTFHANSPKAAMPRLLSMIGQGDVISAEAALPLIAAAFDIIIFLDHSLIDGSRRIMSVVEIPTYPSFDEADRPFLDLRPLWEFSSSYVEDGKVKGEWLRVNDISPELSDARGLDLIEDLTWSELVELSRIDPPENASV